MSRLRIIFAGTVIAALTGCATVKLGDADTESRLKKLDPVPNAVNLYVCRESGFAGGGVRTVVFINKKPIGTLKPKMFAQTIVEPGTHEIYLERDGVYGGKSGTLKVEAKAGEVVIIWAGMTGFGFGTLTVDKFADTKTAQECVKSSTYSVPANDA